MGKIRISKQIILFIGVIAITSCASSTDQKQLDKEMVLQTLKKFDDAVIARDEVTLKAITATNLSYGHSSGKIQDKAEFVDDVVNGSFQFVSITNDNQSVNISENVAIVRHILSADATNAGQPAKVHIGIIMVFQLDENDKMVLLARQAYRLPS
ncbi:nuclear transport factor 2 family protein [Flagellimonas aequoris]|uniref:Nuclear transport factor 2 family protein n=1 Tax=Flagellimonas aequoris TaxID=2306997 RepID=A0A418N816_9FLAO|nr:nuclear transport factor 2 family protein [Allomuricauda aequoris]RIV71381.1 nuclear transport factor 2 family protein [Allomuricauda aequoris]TXK02849.1 nuclear transport factor 2 family protein [Allomuricauda aequoris]